MLKIEVFVWVTVNWIRVILFALAQKALQLPDFFKFFFTVLLDGLTKFFLLKSFTYFL